MRFALSVNFRHGKRPTQKDAAKAYRIAKVHGFLDPASPKLFTETARLLGISIQWAYALANADPEVEAARKKRLESEHRLEAQALEESAAGKTVREVAKSTGLSKSAVQKIVGQPVHALKSLKHGQGVQEIKPPTLSAAADKPAGSAKPTADELRRRHAAEERRRAEEQARAEEAERRRREALLEAAERKRQEAERLRVLAEEAEARRKAEEERLPGRDRARKKGRAGSPPPGDSGLVGTREPNPR